MEYTILIDTDGNGTPDTEIENLVVGTDISVQQPDGTVVLVAVADDDADGDPELTLPGGAIVPLDATVFAPATATPGETDILTISATNLDTAATAPSATLTDQTDVIDSNIRLSKKVGVDTDCDGTPESAPVEVQATEIKPDECAIWEVTATNQGATDATNVKILDTITSFTTYEADSLEYCINLNCAPASVTDAVGNDAGEITGTSVTFYVGDTPNPAAGAGGTLVPGQSVTVRFRVRVD